MKKTRITPEMAQEFLDNQSQNRRPVQAVIDRYAAAMADGVWVASEHLAIRFDNDGRMSDGQHRMHAVIKHGKPVEFFVTMMSKDMLDLVHECKHRSMADRIAIDGSYASNDAKYVASLGTLLFSRVRYGHIHISAKRNGMVVSHVRRDQIYSAIEWAGVDVLKVISDSISIYNLQPSKFRLLTPTMIGYMLAQKAPRVLQFCEELCSDDHPNRCQAAITLRRQMGNASYSSSQRLGLLSRAYNNQDAKLVRCGDVVDDLDGGTFIGR